MKSTIPTPEEIRDFVIAGHGDLKKVQAMLAAAPDLLDAAHPWSESDRETAIMAAAQTGNRAIAEFLLARGAPLSITTAAMLGRKQQVADMLEKDPKLIAARGAHGIPLLAHAALSGDLDLVRMLVEHGAQEGLEYALHNAVVLGKEDLVRWLLENTRPDLGWKNYEGKTALAVADGKGNDPLVRLLREHGAAD
jgi:ankyrin repeat protein